MTEAEKRRRFRRFAGWFYLPMIAGASLVHNALKLRDGEIATAEFLWLSTIFVLAILVGLLIPWAEDRRLRRLAEQRRATRRPPLSLNV
ncbi:hypothetical protein [Caulobacter vibrioides]|uniref:hypothetical protein n=1 Tax=Caulobacter vibrioides TaxID=155892 RepID=UPI000BB512B9|nr:hypothetical protein [Caulobacter vibrioides]ATC25654.1 hypothetical protein CA608_14520 [Caulobacter vibrioides]PLR07716.1 hypothetical protein CVUC_19395 [Caulobacter vibrioides]